MQKNDIFNLVSVVASEIGKAEQTNKPGAEKKIEAVRAVAASEELKAKLSVVDVLQDEALLGYFVDLIVNVTNIFVKKDLSNLTGTFSIIVNILKRFGVLTIN